MTKPSRHIQVNWVDGMKINKNHFITLENAVTARIKDARRLTTDPYSYGLIPDYRPNAAPLKILLYSDNQQAIRVSIAECSALLLGGGRIDISEETANLLGFTISIPEAQYDLSQSKQEELLVVLTVNHYDQQPVGNIDPNEEPPRFPYVIPKVTTTILPASQVNRKTMGYDMLLVGKVQVTDKGPELIQDYIPPCTSVTSHPRLVAYHTQFDKFFSQLEIDAITILKKIHDKEQTSNLAVTLEAVTEPLLSFLSANILSYRWQSPALPPIYMIEHVASCARVLRNAIEANSGKSKEELLNYFVEWCNINQGDFQNMLLRTVNFQYDHTEISKTLTTMGYFAEVISQLFSKLSTLEYIGKKKETSIFVKEQTQQTPVKKSFLAD